MTRVASVLHTEDSNFAYLGNCARVDPEVMFPHRKDKKGNAAAKEVCVGCPVIDLCIEDHLKHDKDFGVWGGTTELEREASARREKRRRRAEK